MANVKEVYESEFLSKAVDKVRTVLYDDFGLAPGDEIYVIQDACHECPDRDDHCGIGCEKRCKKYLEKVRIAEATVILRENNKFQLNITDTNDDEYSASDLGTTVFTDREEALSKL